MSLSDQMWSPTSAQVTVLQARGLRIKGKNGTNDAYAVIQVGKEKFQTSVAEKSVAPVWKEEASFDLSSAHQGDVERGTLHVHVLHRVLVGPDKLLGQAVINLLQLSVDKNRDKTQWFKLLDKAGKLDKDRGEVLVDIQFMRNNMTASMYDISAAGKSRSRLGKFKDKVRGKKKDGLSETASNVVPAYSQVLTDSEDERNSDGDGAAGKDEKKKNKVKSLFSYKSNLQKSLSQSMSVLPGKNSPLSGSVSSGLNVDASEGKKKFKFLNHKRTGSADKKDQKLGAEQSNLCINGSHIYCEEPAPRTSRTSSNFSLTSSGVGSMEDVPDSSPPSVGSTRSVRHSSLWTEEEEEETIEETTQEVDEEMFRRQELEKLAEEESRFEEEEQRRVEEKKREEEEKFRMEEEQRRWEEEIKTEQERLQKEEEEKLAAEMLREEKERKQQEEEVKRLQEEEEGRRIEQEKQQRREEEEKQEKERMKRQEELRLRLEEEEQKRLKEEERQRQEEVERIREEERAMEKRRQEEREEEIRKMEEEKARKERLEEEERQRQEEEERREEERRAMEKRRQEEREEELRKMEEEKARKERLLEEKKQKEEQERIRKEEEERLKIEKEKAEEEQRIEEERKLEEEKKQKAQEEEEKKRLEREEKRQEEERARKKKEEQKRLEEEERRQQELKMEQERMIQEEKIRAEKEKAEELRRKKEAEEYEQLMEEKRKWEEEKQRQQLEEEKKRREEKEALEMKRLAEEKRRLEKEEQKRVQEEERVKIEEDRTASEPQDVTANPFDESDEHVLELVHDEDVLESSRTTHVTSARQRCKLPLETKTCSFDENNVSSMQWEKRRAPKSPRMDSSERQQVAQHEAQVNKLSNDKEMKTASVLPQCAVQKISPVNAPSAHINNSKQPEHSARTARRAAPQRPHSIDEDGLSSKGYTPHKPVPKSKQAPAVYSLNPFEDDNDVDELSDKSATLTTPGSVMRPPPVQQSGNKGAASQMKIKSSKTAHAPAPPDKKAHTSDSDRNHNTDVTIDDINIDKSSAPVPQTLHREHMCVQEEAVKDAPPVPSRRLLPVRPLNPLDQQPVPDVQGERDKSAGEIINGQGKTKVTDSGPYALLTQEELISLVLKQERQLSEKNKKISELEQYIDNLLVRVIEEAPSILMTMALK